jgi:PAS domain S-box-containing protein
MRRLPFPPGIVGLAAISAATVFLPQLGGWPRADRTVELFALTLAAALTAFLRVEVSAARDRTIMAPSFILTFVALLMFGPHVATLVAAMSALSVALLRSDDGYPTAQSLITATITPLAAQGAGQTFQAMGIAFSDVATVWPWHGGLIAAAVVVYVLLQGTLGEFAVPLLTGQKPSHSWVQDPFRGCSIHLVGASVAVGTVALLGERLWAVLPVAAGSLFFAYQTYSDHVNRLDEEHHRREVLAFLEDGMAVVARDGRVTVWNSALERMLGCSRARALGQVVDLAVPALARTEVPKAIKGALTDGKPRLITDVSVPSDGAIGPWK